MLPETQKEFYDKEQTTAIEPIKETVKFEDREKIDFTDPRFKVEAKIISDIQTDVTVIAERLQKRKLNSSCNAVPSSDETHSDNKTSEIRSCKPSLPIEDTEILTSVKEDLIHMITMVECDQLNNIINDVNNVIEIMIGDTPDLKTFRDLSSTGLSTDQAETDKMTTYRTKRSRDDQSSFEDQSTRDDVPEEFQAMNFADAALELILEALGCLMDFMWAQFAGLNSFTYSDCTKCSEYSDCRKERTIEECYCPVMKGGKAQLFKISCCLLCNNPGGCMSLRSLFDL